MTATKYLPGPAALGTLLLLLGAGTGALANEPIHHVPSEVCKACHLEIYNQWSGSMHAQSTALKDPIHAAFYTSEVGSPTEEGQIHKASGKFPLCLGCHAPNAARDKTTKLDAKPAYSEGVNCVACHTLASFKGVMGEDGKLRYGINAYVLADKLQGTSGRELSLQSFAAGETPYATLGNGAPKPNPHVGEVNVTLPLEPNAKLRRSNDVCMGCHEVRNNPHGVPLCATGEEFTDSGTQVNCISCHMPIANGMADHGMGGGHDKAMLRRSVLLEIEVEPKGDKLLAKVSMTNQQPHKLPTGAPFRNMFLKLTAYDPQGKVLWRNADGHPSQGDPQGYFALTLANDEGKPVPPPEATKTGTDTRLKPHETRVLTYEIPAKDVAAVRGELYYNLLWPSLVKKFSDLPEELKAPVLIAEIQKYLHKP